MEKRELRKMAWRSAEDAGYFVTKEVYMKGYETGITEYLDGVWHKADEVPDTGRELLTKRTKGRSFQMDNVPPFLTDEEQKDYCRTHDIERWAYIDDLHLW